MSGFAWVTLATNDSYSLGALVLAHSLRRVNTAHQLAILITPGVSEAMRTQLGAVYDLVKVVDVLDSRDEANLTLLARPELGITFTKLHCWRLTQFNKCVFLDADTLVLQNCDELFEREELSAAPDAGWPDCFNSGVFVFRPSNDTFKKLMDFAVVHGSFDGGDQGLLNLFYKDWATKDISKHLPFIYNMCSTSTYSYLPAFKQFGVDLKIIHFIGSAKPWLQVFDTETGLARVSGESHSIGSFIQLWWDLFCTYVHKSLSTEMGGLAGALAAVELGSPITAEQSALQDHLRRQGWEQGNIDYMGRDSFDNIWKKISETLNIGETTVQDTESSSAVTSFQDLTFKPVESQISNLDEPSPTVSISGTQPVLTSPEASSEITPAESVPASLSVILPKSLPTNVPSSTIATSPETALFTPPVTPSPPIAAPSTPLSSPPVSSSAMPGSNIQIQSPSVTPTKLITPPRSPVTPPSSPKTEELKKPVQPSTPIVTSPTPPTSPPVDPFDTPLPTKLNVETETPETPPAGTQPTTSPGSTDEPPIPPKRKGAKSSQEQTSKTQSKGGKQAVKGKK